MNNVLLFAGTTEGRRVAEACRNQPVTLYVSVATEYGEACIEPADNLRILPGRKDAAQIGALLADTGASLVIDATHPYAAAVTQTLRAVCRESGADYLRLLREEEHDGAQDCVFVENTAEAVAWLNAAQGSALLTVGGKELARYTGVSDYRTRLYARILPLPEAVAQAAALGFGGDRLICMQGPFTEALNAALLRMLGVRYLVTKDTGAAGGFPEKIRAARACGVTPVVIRRPLQEEGVRLADCLAVLEKRFGVAPNPDRRVTVLGVGAGSAGSMTLDAERACRQAGLLVGAKRLTDGLARFGKPVENAVTAQEIAALVRKSPCRDIAVVLSGDSGFYSGAKALLPLLADLRPAVLPGVSSVSCFCSRLGIPWDDALLLSTHGRRCNYLAKIRGNAKVLALTGGEVGAGALIDAMNEYGLGRLRVTVGENLSYENERITSGTAATLAGRSFAPLSVVLTENPAAAQLPVTHGLPDDAFLRADVPMTKQEIRAVTLARLRLPRTGVCWDVGAGTGSVSLEMAACCEDGVVYAVERRADACRLIEQNKRRLGIANVTVVPGTAPDALRQLPAPTHLFVGGSGGGLREILALALQKNPTVRIVLNAVTAETFAEAVAALRDLPVDDPEIVQLSAARGRKAGSHHLLTAMNPVFILSCTGGPNHA